MSETQPRLTVAMLIYPGMTLLDMAGPQTIWGLHGDTYFVWEHKGPVMGDTGTAVVATHDFKDCPTDVDILCVPGGFGTWDVLGNEAALDFLRRASTKARYVTSVCTGSIILAAAGLLDGRNAPANLDVLFVPGGFGTNDMMKDLEVLDFLAQAGASARYVTSVCTGSVILAMAGLLDGYRAATHWAFYEPLEALGVEPSHERVCVDRNRITGGGVTAGVDFGLTLLAELKGQDVAEFTQLALEYDPAPPFNAGHPRTARAEIVDMIAGPQGIMGGQMTPAAMDIVRAHKQRLGASVPA